MYRQSIRAHSQTQPRSWQGPPRRCRRRPLQAGGQGTRVGRGVRERVQGRAERGGKQRREELPGLRCFLNQLGKGRTAGCGGDQQAQQAQQATAGTCPARRGTAGTAGTGAAGAACGDTAGAAGTSCPSPASTTDRPCCASAARTISADQLTDTTYLQGTWGEGARSRATDALKACHL